MKRASNPAAPAGEPVDRRDARRALGREGEARAARFLASRGYRIVARNLRCDGVEVDLIACTREVIAFVEVKTRRSSRFGPASEALTRQQSARLVRAAVAWLADTSRFERARRHVRFDLVSCEVAPDGAWRVRHWPAAFDAETSVPIPRGPR